MTKAAFDSRASKVESNLIRIKDICKDITYRLHHLFDFNLTRVKGTVKVVNTFELTFDSSQRYMQRRHIFDVFLMRIKSVVKNVIIFDLIFDTNQKKSKSNFSCSVYIHKSRGEPGKRKND